MKPSLPDLSTFVVEQKRKLFEMRSQYRIFDESGSQVGAVEQRTQSPLAFLARLGTDLDLALPTTLDVSDTRGETILVLHKPWFRMTLDVSRGDGTPLGSISKRIKLGKARFTITDYTGQVLGEVLAQNWRAKDFHVVDQQGGHVAEVTKKWRGLASEAFTDADTYVVNLMPHAIDPIRSLALAASLAIDVVMKQKDY